MCTAGALLDLLMPWATGSTLEAVRSNVHPNEHPNDLESKIFWIWRGKANFVAIYVTIALFV